ncbi:discoidin domain-containing protein [bacterium]|nr:discoidin domain-containing protein [bacterium]
MKSFKVFTFSLALFSSLSFAFQSYPSATQVLYIDFDGEVVNGKTVSSDKTLDMADQLEITKITGEDYSPFRLNVTNERGIYDATPSENRLMVIITDSLVSGVPNNVGGIAGVVGALPGYVFSHNLSRKNNVIGRNITHEAGHSYGLSHDGNSTFDYWFGNDNQCSIMGTACDIQGVAQWSKGEYLDANNQQDDIQILSTFFGGLRVDDHSDETSSATPITMIPLTSNSNLSGVISSRTDLDLFSFTTSGGSINVTANPSSYTGNLDIGLSILNNLGTVVNTAGFNTTDQSATISTYLTAGTYFLKVEGVGYGDPLVNGYTDYGSLGEYFISGTINGLSVTHSFPIINSSTLSQNQIFSSNMSDPISITQNITDSDGIASVVFKLDGVVITNQKSGSNYSSSLLITEEGPHTFTSIATDNLGFETIKNYDFKVNSSCTSVKYTQITPESYPTSYSNNPIENLFDGDYDPYKTWALLPSSPRFVVFSTATSPSINKLRLYNGSAINRAASYIKIYNSNDTTNWGPAIVDKAISQKAEITINMPTVNGKYYRVEFTENNNGYGFSLRELEIFEPVCSVNTSSSNQMSSSVALGSNNQVSSSIALSSSNQVSSSAALSSSNQVSSSFALSSSSQINNTCGSVPHCLDDMVGNWVENDECQFDGSLYRANWWVNIAPPGSGEWTDLGVCQNTLSSSELLSSSLQVLSSSSFTFSSQWLSSSNELSSQELSSSSQLIVANQINRNSIRLSNTNSMLNITNLDKNKITQIRIISLNGIEYINQTVKSESAHVSISGLSKNQYIVILKKGKEISTHTLDIK